MTRFHRGPGRRAGRAVTIALLAISSLLAFSGGALAADPVATPAPPRLSYLTDLATPGSYVGQYNYVQCVGAAVQMMRNMVLDTADHSPYMQHLLWYRARHWSKYSGDGGADPFGWAAVLTSPAQDRTACMPAAPWPTRSMRSPGPWLSARDRWGSPSGGAVMPG